MNHKILLQEAMQSLLLARKLGDDHERSRLFLSVRHGNKTVARMEELFYCNFFQMLVDGKTLYIRPIALIYDSHCFYLVFDTGKNLQIGKMTVYEPDWLLRLIKYFDIAEKDPDEGAACIKTCKHVPKAVRLLQTCAIRNYLNIIEFHTTYVALLPAAKVHLLRKEVNR